jgi:hypothetical protein
MGLATSPLMAKTISNSDFNSGISIAQEKEKVKVDPANLPGPVKNSIERDETLKTLKISEAWHVSGENGPKHFLIKFENGGEELVKKYTSLGEEIED